MINHPSPTLCPCHDRQRASWVATTIYLVQDACLKATPLHCVHHFLSRIGGMFLVHPCPVLQLLIDARSSCASRAVKHVPGVTASCHLPNWRNWYSEGRKISCDGSSQADDGHQCEANSGCEPHSELMPMLKICLMVRRTASVLRASSSALCFSRFSPNSVSKMSSERYLPINAYARPAVSMLT